MARAGKSGSDGVALVSAAVGTFLHVVELLALCVYCSLVYRDRSAGS